MAECLLFISHRSHRLHRISLTECFFCQLMKRDYTEKRIAALSLGLRTLNTKLNTKPLFLTQTPQDYTDFYVCLVHANYFVDFTERTSLSPVRGGKAECIPFVARRIRRIRRNSLTECFLSTDETRGRRGRIATRASASGVLNNYLVATEEVAGVYPYQIDK